ncbi:PH domain-containing protein [Mycetocola reblochoni]|uniref:PH domain-containing protein n=5 Tax=Mycetocola reblochoni TaxID=331618 RepID=A0A3L6ZN99_9MICO|nr:PH domain-containing protein [Mycetocola reblochoni]
MIGSAIALLVIVGASIGVILLFDWSPVIVGWIGGALAALSLLELAITPRRVRSIRYLLREDDLIFRKGIMWQRIVAVPYGRMQLVDINRGPIARMFGLSELKFVTASSGSDITIPGLPEAQAVELRDHLVAVAESRRSGL